MSDYFYNKETDTMYVYKTITVKELLELKNVYTHVEVVGNRKKKRW